jgi:hypothetical protein
VRKEEIKNKKIKRIIHNEKIYMTEGWIQVLTIIGSILIPTLVGFGWVLHQISDLKTRMTVIETILAMMGAPLKIAKKDER